MKKSNKSISKKILKIGLPIIGLSGITIPGNIALWKIYNQRKENNNNTNFDKNNNQMDLNNIKGEKGADGKDGTSFNLKPAQYTKANFSGKGSIQGQKGDAYITTDTHEIMFYNGSQWTTIGALPKGEKGADGNDGTSFNLKPNKHKKADFGGTGSIQGQKGDAYITTDTHEIMFYNGSQWTTIAVLPKGVQGEKGEKGDQGKQGVQGEQGVQGKQGADGNDGTSFNLKPGQYKKADFGGTGSIQGQKGDAYITTDTHEIMFYNGSQWTTIAVLPKGVQGEKGEKGDQGKQGVQGEQGVQGKQGADGNDGTSFNLKPSQYTKADFGSTGSIHGQKGDAYITTDTHEMMFYNGFLWTTIGALPKGDQGEQGEQGDQGAQGIQGAQGKKGDQGAQGIQGIQGKKGDQGAQGIQGKKGAQGIQGEKGADGKDGTSFNLKPNKHKKADFSGKVSIQGQKGDAYITTDTHEIMFYNGSQWTTIGALPKGEKGDSRKHYKEFTLQKDQVYKVTTTGDGEGIIKIQSGTVEAKVSLLNNKIKEDASFINKFTNELEIDVMSNYFLVKAKDGEGILSTNNFGLGFSVFQVTKTEETIKKNSLKSWKKLSEKALKGDQGAQGIQGKKGSDGKDGTSFNLKPNKHKKADFSGKVSIQGQKGDAYITTDTHEIMFYNGSQWTTIGALPKGDQGAQGIQGKKGDQGAQGIQGKKGEKGDQGAQGIQGKKGSDGKDGTSFNLKPNKHKKADFSGKVSIQGQKGDAYITTDTHEIMFYNGSQWTTIGALPKGDQGAQGIQGKKGDQGAQGIQGKKGEKGDQGAQGIQGEKGADGKDGTSFNLKPNKHKKADFSGKVSIQGQKGDAYITTDTHEIMFYNGSQWTTIGALPKGDQGAQGIQGKKGEKGDQGAQGIQGKKGSDGKDGTSFNLKPNKHKKADFSGKVSIQGQKGDAYITTDTHEIMFYNGSQWTTIGTLPKGDQGIQGKKGDQGAQGIQGKKGDQGAQGIQGKKGSDGKDGTSFNLKPNKHKKADFSGKVSIQGQKGDAYITTDTHEIMFYNGSQWTTIGALPKGDQGAQGIQGKKGDQGAQGIQGKKGEKGDQGAQGIQGEKGADGKDGTSFNLKPNKHKKADFSGKVSIQGQKGDAYITTDTHEIMFYNGSQWTTIGTLPKGEKGDSRKHYKEFTLQKDQVYKVTTTGDGEGIIKIQSGSTEAKVSLFNNKIKRDSSFINNLNDIELEIEAKGNYFLVKAKAGEGILSTNSLGVQFATFNVKPTEETIINNSLKDWKQLSQIADPRNNFKQFILEEDQVYKVTTTGDGEGIIKIQSGTVEAKVSLLNNEIKRDSSFINNLTDNELEIEAKGNYFLVKAKAGEGILSTNSLGVQFATFNVKPTEETIINNSLKDWKQLSQIADPRNNFKQFILEEDQVYKVTTTGDGEGIIKIQSGTVEAKVSLLNNEIKRDSSFINNLTDNELEIEAKGNYFLVKAKNGNAILSTNNLGVQFYSLEVSKTNETLSKNVLEEVRTISHSHYKEHLLKSDKWYRFYTTGADGDGIIKVQSGSLELVFSVQNNQIEYERSYRNHDNAGNTNIFHNIELKLSQSLDIKAKTKFIYYIKSKFGNGLIFTHSYKVQFDDFIVEEVAAPSHDGHAKAKWRDPQPWEIKRLGTIT